MSLKDIWSDKVGGVDYVLADDINSIAHAVIDLEEIDTEMSDTSTNAVQNKVVKTYIDESVGDVEDKISDECVTKSGLVNRLNELKDNYEIKEVSIPIKLVAGGFTTDGNFNDNATNRARSEYLMPVNLACTFKFQIGTKHRFVFYDNRGIPSGFISMTDWSENIIENVEYPNTVTPASLAILIGYTDDRNITTTNLPNVKIEYEYIYSKNVIPYVEGYYISGVLPTTGKRDDFILSPLLPVVSGKTYRAKKFRNTATYDAFGNAIRLLETSDIQDNKITINEGEAFVSFCWKKTDCDIMYFAENEKYIEIDVDSYPLLGKKLSLLGDSISAYVGTIPTGNDAYYNGSNSGVTDKSQMWWSVLCDKTGMTPLVINAWSGSAITTLTDDAHSQKTPMSDVSRSKALHNGSLTPDVIIIAGGVNDYSYANSSQHNPNGWNGRTAPVKGNSFGETYACMIKDIQDAYPSAIIICLSTWFTMRGADNGYTLVNGTGFTQSDYDNEIERIAKIMCVPFINVEKCGFNRNNFYPAYAEDSDTIPTHPNANGQKVMGEYLADMIPTIVSAYVSN